MNLDQKSKIIEESVRLYPYKSSYSSNSEKAIHETLMDEKRECFLTGANYSVSKSIGFSGLRYSNVERQKEWNTGSEELSLAYKGNELAGEVGELCNILKKIERERIGIKGTRATIKDAEEELADVIICVDLIAEHLGIDVEEAVTKKFNKTSLKYGFKTMFFSYPE